MQMRETADRFRDCLVNRFGPERGGEIDHAEVFEASEYGGSLTPELEAALFSY